LYKILIDAEPYNAVGLEVRNTTKHNTKHWLYSTTKYSEWMSKSSKCY